MPTSEFDQIRVDQPPDAESGRKLWLPGAEHVGSTALQAIEQEAQRISAEQGHVRVLGRIGELITNPYAEWTGVWSLDDRIRNGELDLDDVQALFQQIPHDYRPTNKGALVRCIDEREEVGYEDSLHTRVNERLGPQIAGGTLEGAIVYRQTKSRNLQDFEKASQADDIRMFGSINLDTGFVPADHDGTGTGGGEDEIDCIAVAKGEESARKFNFNNVRTIGGLTQAILGSEYNDEHFSGAVTSSMFLAAVPGYFLPIREQKAVLTELNPRGLPRLKGPHYGVGLMFNEVPFTTLPTNHISARSGGRLQMFGNDLWYTRMMAAGLFPDSEQDQSRYVHTRMAKAVATFMNISKDGSHFVGHRTPAES